MAESHKPFGRIKLDGPNGLGESAAVNAKNPNLLGRAGGRFIFLNSEIECYRKGSDLNTKIFLTILIGCLFSVIAQTISLTGKVVGVKDGDTIVLLTSDKQQITVRLHGIDCPEKNQPFGTKAKQFTSDMVFGKTVQLKIKSTDRYGRSVGEIITEDGISLNHELIRNGYAWWYRQYAKNDTRLEDAESMARKERIGLWQDKTPIPPWEFRKNGKSTEKLTAPVQSSTNEQEVVFNTKSKRYHCPTCNSVKTCKNCIPMSLDEVKKNGGIPCGNCNGVCR